MDTQFLVNRYFKNKRIGQKGFYYTFEPYGFIQEPFYEPYILQPGKCFVDVGANIGGWTIPASKYYEEIHSFEANPNTAKVLARNVKLNNLRNVHINSFALGESESQRDFFLYKGKGQDSFLSTHLGYTTTGNRVLVRIKPLDLLGLEPDRIKIDTEGYEFQVLLGAKKTIAENKPMLLIETHNEKDVPLIRDSLPGYKWKYVNREHPGSIRQTIMIGETDGRDFL